MTVTKTIAFDVPGGTLRIGINMEGDSPIVVLLDPLPRSEVEKPPGGNVDLEARLACAAEDGALHAVEAMLLSLLAHKPDFDVEVLRQVLTTALDGIGNHL